MKILQILQEQQINSVAALRDAFDIEKWYNIISYYNYDTIVDLSQDGRRDFLRRANREIGSQTQTNQSLSDWLTSANRYNMRFNRGVSAQDIYNEISPYANRKVIDYSQEQPLSTGEVDDDHTPEEATEVASWAEGPITFNQHVQVHDYFQTWERALREKRGEEWFGLIFNAQNGQNSLRQEFITVVQEVYEIISNSGSISKTAVDAKLYGWLIVADYGVHMSQNNQNN